VNKAVPVSQYEEYLNELNKANSNARHERERLDIEIAQKKGELLALEAEREEWLCIEQHSDRSLTTEMVRRTIEHRSGDQDND
jgi:hypothetical protein